MTDVEHAATTFLINV